MQIRSRLRYGDCKECQKIKRVLKGSLQDKFPQIAKEWDYSRNSPVTPSNIKPRARKKYWWLCPEKRHNYSASPDNRAGNGSRCPFCYGNKKINSTR
jgi:hypothetical protein